MVKISSSVHTRIEGGMRLRKEILETALKTTQLLQLLKQYKGENIDKKKMITKFKNEITILRETVHELEFKDLPQEITRKIIQPTIPEQKIEVKPLKEVAKEIKQEIEKPIVKSEMEVEIESIRKQIEDIKI